MARDDDRDHGGSADSRGGGGMDLGGRDGADGADAAPADGVEIPIDGTLDLHTFSPREVKDLVPDYLAECRARGILQVRIVHGKGTGTLRRSVHAILGRLPEVESFALADQSGGAWGATLVTLKPP